MYLEEKLGQWHTHNIKEDCMGSIHKHPHEPIAQLIVKFMITQLAVKSMIVNLIRLKPFTPLTLHLEAQCLGDKKNRTFSQD